MIKKHIEKILNIDAYIFILTIVLVLSNISFVRTDVQNVLYYFVILGFILFLFLLKKDDANNLKELFKNLPIQIILLGVFILFYSFNVLLFRNIVVSENIKSIIWLMFFMIVCFYLGYKSKKTDLFYNTLLYSVSTINFVALIMYLFTFSWRKNFLIGVIDNRLWGIYFDPNHGACLNVIVLLVGVYKYTKEKKVKYLFLSFLNLFYIIFSLSRGGLLSMMITFVFGVFLFNLSIKGIEIKKRMKTLIVPLLFLFSYLIIDNGLPYIPHYITQIREEMGFANSNINEEYKDKTEGENINNGYETHEHTNNVIDDMTTNVENEGASVNEIPDVIRTDGTESFNMRLNLLIEAFNMSTNHIITGVGDRNIKYYASLNDEKFPLLAEGRSIHNAFFTLLVSSGYVATLYLLSVIFLNGIKAILTFIKNNSSQMFLSILVCVSCLCAALTLTEVFYAQTLITFIFWFSFGNVVKQNEEN